MGVFLDNQGQITLSCGPIWSKYELLLDTIHVFNTYKFKMDQINSNRDQRTNGPVNAHLISWSSKAQNIQNLENIWFKK